jgi:hypothetical protein
MWSYDEICIGIRVADKWYEVSERRGYFDAWTNALEKALPIRTDWWGAVAFPPFEQCWTQLYKRGEVNSENIK